MSNDNLLVVLALYKALCDAGYTPSQAAQPVVALYKELYAAAYTPSQAAQTVDETYGLSAG
mgnify:CR=1 FL=1